MTKKQTKSEITKIIRFEIERKTSRKKKIY